MLRNILALLSIGFGSTEALAQMQPPNTAAPSWLALELDVELLKGNASYSEDRLSKVVTFVDLEGEPNRVASGAAFVTYLQGEALFKLSTDTYRRIPDPDDPKFVNVVESKFMWSLKPEKSAPGMMVYAKADGYVAQLNFHNPTANPRNLTFALFLDRKRTSDAGKGIYFSGEKKCNTEVAFSTAFTFNAEASGKVYNRAGALRIEPAQSCIFRIFRTGGLSRSLNPDDGEVRARFGFKERSSKFNAE